MKAMDKMYYLVALVLQGIALILEILPVGAVMVFATSPTERTIEVYSYFSMLPVGYANFTPLLTGILTILIVLLGVIALFKFDKATCIRKVIFVCSIVSLLFSIVPLFLFGAVGMTAASYAVSCMILLSDAVGLEVNVLKNDMVSFKVANKAQLFSHEIRIDSGVESIGLFARTWGRVDGVVYFTDIKKIDSL